MAGATPRLDIRLLRCNIRLGPDVPGPRGFVCRGAGRAQRLMQRTNRPRIPTKRCKALSSNPIFQTNPFLSQWLSAANSAAGAWRGLWTAELARQQGAMMMEFNRQALRFWTSLAPVASQQVAAASAAVPAAAEPAAAPAAAPLQAPAATVAEPLAAEPVAAETPAPAEPIATRRPRAPKSAPLRAATPRRKATPKRPAAPSGKRPRITRH